jgi:hypothetical protein
MRGSQSHLDDRDDRETPILIEAEWREVVEMICPTGIAEYFCKNGWTEISQNCPSGKSLARNGAVPTKPSRAKLQQISRKNRSNRKVFRPGPPLFRRSSDSRVFPEKTDGRNPVLYGRTLVLRIRTIASASRIIAAVGLLLEYHL